MQDNNSDNILTQSTGCPVDDNQNSLTAGEYGPILMQDTHLIDKLAHFDRERIPERVVHAKGTGAHGYFEVTADMTKYCKAKFLDTVGKKTPVFARLSTVGGERGTADSERDPRGFAVKFYTEEGNYDMTGNNTPVFFIRDPMKFPDFIHTQKRNPQTNLKDANMFWDFLSLVPESAHQVTVLFSNRGTPNGYRHTNGYTSHAFRWVNKEGEAFWIKLHFKCDAGNKSLTGAEADEMRRTNPDFATQDLFEHLASGKVATWTVQVQIMPESDGYKYKWNIFDVTKVWPHSDYPCINFGKMVLNRNPENYFQEVEQSAFSPGHLVPGIEPSLDKMLQGRLFSYPDTHRHRLGTNYTQFPINCPYRARVITQQRDGPQTFDNQGNRPNYEPNSFQPLKMIPESKTSQYKVTGLIGRFKPAHPNDDFAQPGILYRKVMCDNEKYWLITNIVNHLKNANRVIQERQVKIFTKCDPQYGERVAQGLGFPNNKARL